MSYICEACQEWDLGTECFCSTCATDVQQDLIKALATINDSCKERDDIIKQMTEDMLNLLPIAYGSCAFMVQTGSNKFNHEALNNELKLINELTEKYTKDGEG